MKQIHHIAVIKLSLSMGARESSRIDTISMEYLICKTVGNIKRLDMKQFAVSDVHR